MSDRRRKKISKLKRNQQTDLRKSGEQRNFRVVADDCMHNDPDAEAEVSVVAMKKAQKVSVKLRRLSRKKTTKTPEAIFDSDDKSEKASWLGNFSCERPQEHSKEGRYDSKVVGLDE